MKRIIIYITICCLLASLLNITVMASAPGKPAAPTATGVGPDRFTVNWKYVPGANNYQIFRKVGTGAESKVHTFNDAGAKDALDLVFVIDRSYSMSAPINNVKNNLTNFVNTLKTSGISIRYGLVTYSDSSYPYPAPYFEPEIKTDFTSDPEVFKNNLSAIKIVNGYDNPESGLEALARGNTAALNFDFRPNAARHIIMVTDNKVHVSGTQNSVGIAASTYSIEGVVEQLKDKDITVNIVGSYLTDIMVQLKSISDPTGGIYTNVASQNFSEALATVADNIITNRSHELTGLKENTQYTIRIKSCANTLCSDFSDPLVVTTKLDTNPPTKTSGLVVSDITTTSFDLSWAAASDNIAVTKYYIKINGARVTKGSPPVEFFTANLSTTVDGLSRGVTYSVAVEACDAKDNCSTSDPISVTTRSTSAPPLPPEELMAYNVARDTFILAWSEADDDEGVIGYKVYKNGELYDGDISSDETELVVTGLSAATTYSMTIVSVDAEGQLSPESEPLDVETLGPNESMGPDIVLGVTRGETSSKRAMVYYRIKQREATEGDAGFMGSSATVSAILIDKSKNKTGPTVIKTTSVPVTSRIVVVPAIPENKKTGQPYVPPVYAPIKSSKNLRATVDTSLASIPSGTYYLVIKVVDPTDPTRVTYAYKRLVVDRIAPVISEIVVPNITDMAVPKSIVFDLAENNTSGVLVKNGKTSARVSIIVKNRVTSKIVKTISRRIAQASETGKTISWAVKDKYGVDLPDGSYTISFDSYDVVKNKMNTINRNFTIERKAPEITKVTDTPAILKVNGKSKATINYTLSEDATVTIRIYDVNDVPVQTIVNSKPLKVGKNMAYWNGYGSANYESDPASIAKLPAGKYSYKIDAVDASGKQAIQFVGWITTE